METLTLAAVITAPAVAWALTHRQNRKMTQRLDIQARLLGEIADLIAAIPAPDAIARHLHIVREPGATDLASLETLLLQLHLCNHRQASGR